MRAVRELAAASTRVRILPVSRTAPTLRRPLAIACVVMVHGRVAMTHHVMPMSGRRCMA